LRQAYELGRAAVAEGKGILEVVAVHHAALQKILAVPCMAANGASVLRNAEKFLVESLSPYEMTHRGFKEALVSLRQLNDTLEHEIQRIAHAVHDEAGQLLATVHLALADIARDLPSSLQSRECPALRWRLSGGSQTRFA
jgi:signal transduction histidine kinase